jgi:uncharacterized protein (TIGR04255 family)
MMPVLPQRSAGSLSKKYKNPPLVEALCEFRFEPDSPWDITVPGLIYERVKSTFKERRQMNLVNFEVTTTPTGIQQALQSADRIQFVRDDGTALLQVAPGLLTINHLKPYPSWEIFRPMILAALSDYAEAAPHSVLDTLTLRYINRFDFSGPKVDVEDFFNFYPHVGSDLPQTYISFISGVQFEYENPPSLLRMQIANTADQTPDRRSMMLDLTYVIPVHKPLDFAPIERYLNTAHDNLENAFEASIRDDLRATFDEEK